MIEILKTNKKIHKLFFQIKEKKKKNYKKKINF